MNLSGMYDACEGILSTSAIQQKCCVECYHFSPRGNSDIVNQSHMVGACPPPRVNISTGKVYFPIIAFAGFVLRLFSVLQLYQLEDYSLLSLPWCLYHISSGRMSSLHILREDELQNNQLFLYYLGTCHHISSGRMSSLHILREDELQNNSLFFHYLSLLIVSQFTLVLVPHILREDELATYPQGG